MRCAQKHTDFLVLVLACFSFIAGSCETGWTEHECSCYKKFAETSDLKDWASAQVRIGDY